MEAEFFCLVTSELMRFAVAEPSHANSCCANDFSHIFLVIYRLIIVRVDENSEKMVTEHVNQPSLCPFFLCEESV